MALLTIFDDLPDLALIDLFTYLSSFDVLWSFTGLNGRLTALLFERGYFRHINLSSARRRQFDTLLQLLPLNSIETLVVDGHASFLQLTRWPHAPRLRSLTLMGLRDFNNVLPFLLRHAATLIHLTIGSDELDVAVSVIVLVGRMIAFSYCSIF